MMCAGDYDTRMRGVGICVEISWEITVGKVRADHWEPWMAVILDCIFKGETLTAFKGLKLLFEEGKSESRIIYSWVG